MFGRTSREKRVLDRILRDFPWLWAVQSTWNPQTMHYVAVLPSRAAEDVLTKVVGRYTPRTFWLKSRICECEWVARLDLVDGDIPAIKIVDWLSSHRAGVVIEAVAYGDPISHIDASLGSDEFGKNIYRVVPSGRGCDLATFCREFTTMREVAKRSPAS